MRIVACFAFLCLFASGCLASEPAQDDASRNGAEQSSVPVQPYVVGQTEFMTATSGGAGSLSINLDYAVSAVAITIEFGSSAFTNLQFTSPQACEGVSAGAGVYPNSATWNGECGPLAAGSHTLAWSVDGAAQGTVTATAIP